METTIQSSNLIFKQKSIKFSLVVIIMLLMSFKSNTTIDNVEPIQNLAQITTKKTTGLTANAAYVFKVKDVAGNQSELSEIESLITLPVGSGSGSIYYVSNSGNDSNDGLSLANAFETLQHAADLVQEGDTVLVEDGTYIGFDLRNKSGSDGSPIVFQASGDNVLINQSGPIRNDIINIENSNYITIDGFITNNAPGNGNGIRIVTSNFCIVRNNSCDNNAERGIFTAFTDDILIEHNVCTNSIDEHGIYVSNSSDRPIIRYNECYGNNRIGIHLNGDLTSGGDGIISDALVYGNIIHDNNLAAGINMDGLENPIVFNNLIYNNHFAQGIALFQQDGAIVTNGAKIFNNTIIVPDDGRWGILVQNGANVNTEIYNNIIINQHAWRGCIAIESTNQFTSDYNVLNDKMSDSGDGSTISLADWQALGFDNHSQLANSLDQLFINPTANDYQLPASSQAIDIGTDLVNSIVTDDIIGTTRPLGVGYDIGAYEYNSNLSNNDSSLVTLKIVPNPTSNYFILDYDETKVFIKTIDLIDMTGKRIKSFITNKLLSVTSITSGLYIIRIQLDDGKVLSKKLIIY